MITQPGARLVVSHDVLARRVGDELVLLNMATEIYFGLDPVGTTMWEALAKHGTTAAAYEALVELYDVEPEKFRADLEELVGQLVEKGLLAAHDG